MFGINEITEINNTLYTYNRPPLYNNDVDISTVVKKQAWYYEDVIKSKVVQILANYKQVFETFDITFEDLNRAVFCLYWYFNKFKCKTYTRVPNRFVVDVSQTSRKKVDLIITLLGMTELFDIKLERFYILYKPNVSVFDEDVFTQRKIKANHIGYQHKLNNIYNKNISVYFNDYNKKIKHNHLKETILCYMLAYSELNSDKVFYNIRLFKDGHRIMYVECPTELIANILHTKPENVRSYVRKLCNGSNYIERHNKVYTDETVDKFNKIKSKIVNPAHYLNEDYKQYVLSNWNDMNDTNGLSWETTHPRVTKDSYIIFLDNFEKCKTGKKVLNTYRTYKQSVITHSQFIEVYKFLNINNLSSLENNNDLKEVSLQSLHQDMTNKLSDEDLDKISELDISTCGVGSFYNNDNPNDLEDKVFKKRIKLKGDSLSCIYSYDIIKALRATDYRLTVGDKKDFKYYIKLYNICKNELVKRMVKNWEYMLVNFVENPQCNKLKQWQRDNYILNEYKVINELLKHYLPKYYYEIYSQFLDTTMNRYKLLEDYYNRFYLLLGDSNCTDKQMFFRKYIKNLENTELYKNTSNRQNILIDYSNPNDKSKYDINPYKIYEQFKQIKTDKQLEEEFKNKIVDKDKYFEINNWKNYFSLAYKLKQCLDENIKEKIKKSLIRFTIKHYGENIYTLKDYVLKYEKPFEAEDYESYKYGLSIICSDETTIDDYINDIKAQLYELKNHKQLFRDNIKTQTDDFFNEFGNILIT